MNQKTKFALLLLPIVGLGGAVFWAKWKLTHPTPTEHDLEVRQLFIQSKSAIIVPTQFNSHQSAHYALTQKDKQELASHLWFREALPNTTHPPTSCVIRWDEGSLLVGANWQQDRCALRSKNYLDEWKVNWVLHPTSSLYLHHWLRAHPQIKEKLGLQIQ